jgi:DNA-binding winged helix-turn-helix (wHTH) protein
LHAEVCRFEDFELDPSAYRLRRKGRAVHLEPIPFRLLCLLAERHGQLVTREEILERIWGKGIFIDGESSINAAVRKIRRALNDDRETPRFVVTVPSRGYRFEALLRAASGTPTHSDGIFNTDLRIAELEVPRSVRLVIGRRLARLSDRTRRTLGTAATIGRLFNLELLEASTKAEASSLLESAEEAERAGLVFSGTESPTAPFCVLPRAGPAGSGRRSVGGAPPAAAS